MLNSQKLSLITLMITDHINPYFVVLGTIVSVDCIKWLVGKLKETFRVCHWTDHCRLSIPKILKETIKAINGMAQFLIRSQSLVVLEFISEESLGRANRGLINILSILTILAPIKLTTRHLSIGIVIIAALLGHSIDLQLLKNRLRFQGILFATAVNLLLMTIHQHLRRQDHLDMSLLLKHVKDHTHCRGAGKGQRGIAPFRLILIPCNAKIVPLRSLSLKGAKEDIIVNKERHVKKD